MNYSPGPANMAHVDKDGDDWTLILVKELRHDPEKVWDALTDPEQLKEWAPFDASKNLGQVGPLTLTTVGMPANPSQDEVICAERPHLLEYNWGGKVTRWELEPTPTGTKLTLSAKTDRRFIAMGAAGWHLCLDVMEIYLSGDPIGRIVAGDALKFEGWQRLNHEYSEQFGVEVMSW